MATLISFTEPKEIQEFELNKEIEEKKVLELAKSIHNDPKYWGTPEFSGEPYYPGRLTEEVVKYKQPDLALKFMEAAWNTKSPYKESFKKDLKELLSTNPYWQQLQARGYKLPC